MERSTLFDNGQYYLRAIEESDLQWLADLRNHPETWPFLGTLNFTNLVKQKAWYEKSTLDPKQMNFIFCDKLDRLGFVRVDEIDTVNGNVRVGGDIHPAHRGKGLGKEMYKLIFDLAFNQLRMHRVWLLVTCFNKRAQELYKKIGMKEEGKQKDAIFRNGKYYDYIMMSILEPEYRTWLAGQNVTV